MARDSRDNTSQNTTGDTSNATPNDAVTLLPTTELEVDERDIPVGMQLIDIVSITPESAVGGLLVNSPAGSGPVIYPDFRTAVRDAWGEFEAGYSVDGRKPLMGEAVPPELREARRSFKALLDRFERDGFSAYLAEELNELSAECTPYRVVEVSYVLPEGLEDLLDTAYRCLDEEDEEALASAPPRDAFDLHDPNHLEWLEKQLDFLQYV